MKRRGDITVLVCGGRDYANQERVFKVMDQLHRQKRIGLVVHGAATGADTLAEGWAKKRQVMYFGVPAPWKELGRSAGPKRNSYMLERSKPDLVVSFPGGSGTNDMMSKAMIGRRKTVAVDDTSEVETLFSDILGDR